MRSAALVIALSAVGAAGAWASDEPLTLNYEVEFVHPPETRLGLPESLRDTFDPARELLAPNDDQESRHHHSGQAEFTIGPMAGLLKARGADRGTWFGGVDARLRFLRILAVEGSISFHQNRYSDGDVVVTQYPVHVSALLLPFPEGPLDPYVLAGVGWYYNRIDYANSIGGGYDMDSPFGFHVGAGTNLWLARHLSLFGDFRWVFLDRPGINNSNIRDQDFDYWQVTFEVNFGFSAFNPR